MIYIDTSILAAYYCPEPMSERVESFLIQAEKPAISLLTEVELASTLSRKIREKNLSQRDGNKILALFQNHLLKNFFCKIPIEAIHFMMSKDWIARFNTPLRTLDALHLAVAATADCPIVSADERMKQSADLLGIEVLSLYAV